MMRKEINDMSTEDSTIIGLTSGKIVKDIALSQAESMLDVYADEPLTKKDKILGPLLLFSGIVILLGTFTTFIIMGYKGLLPEEGSEIFLWLGIIFSGLGLSIVLLVSSYSYCMKLDSHNLKAMKRWEKILEKEGRKE